MIIFVGRLVHYIIIIISVIGIIFGFHHSINVMTIVNITDGTDGAGGVLVIIPADGQTASTTLECNHDSASTSAPLSYHGTTAPVRPIQLRDLLPS